MLVYLYIPTNMRASLYPQFHNIPILYVPKYASFIIMYIVNHPLNVYFRLIHATFLTTSVPL